MGLTRLRWIFFLAGIICLGPVFSQSEPLTWTPIELPAPATNDLAEVIFESDDGAIWFAFTRAGLYRYNGYDFTKIEPAFFGLDPPDLDRIISIHQMTDGKIWMSARGGSIVNLDPNTKQAEKLIAPANSTISECLKRVWDFYEDKEHTIWMATWQGLVRYQSEKKQFDVFQVPFKTKRNDPVHPSVFRKIRPDPDDENVLWLGGISGLFTFEKKTATFVHHLHPASIYKDGHSDFPPEHSQYLMTDMAIDRDFIYLASWGGGILEFNKKTGNWRNYLIESYHTKRELDENVVNQLVTLGNKIFFAAVPRSGWLDLSTGQMDFGSEEDEKLTQNTYALLKDRQGVIWVSTYENRIIKTQTGEKSELPGALPVFELLQIRTDGKFEWNLWVDSLPDKVYLGPEEDSLFIAFAVINPMDKNNVEYQYKIRGYTRDWISNGTQNFISISDMEKGKHMLSIRANENKGNWIYGPDLLLIKSIYFYQHIWFWIGIMAILGALAFLYIRIRIRALFRKEKLEKDMVQLKMQALQAQMNPHFIFNSLNSINNYILKNDPEKASDYLTLFSRLVREILSNSEEKLISLQRDIDILDMYLKMEKQRFSGKFEMTFQVAAGIDQANCMVPPLVIQPYVENAIWHGLMHLEGKGKLEINYRKEKDQLVIEIIDNGVGRMRSKLLESSGYKAKKMGQALASTRIEMLNKMLNTTASVNISDAYPGEKDVGTKVMVRLPYIISENLTKFIP